MVVKVHLQQYDYFNICFIVFSPCVQWRVTKKRDLHITTTYL